MRRIRIGVLALQGAFQLHQSHLESADADYIEVITSADLDRVDGLILPGGESGTLLKLIDSVGIGETLSSFLKSKPAWGICAGAILLAKTVGNPTQRSFGAIDIEIERNSYGRQNESFEEKIEDYWVSYIRAPKIIKTGPPVEVLSKWNGDPTWVESGQVMITTFHPETSPIRPSPWHTRFVKAVQKFASHE